MAQFVVVSAPKVPDVGSTTQVAMYLGEHATANEAATAAAAIFNKSTGDHLYVVDAANFASYVCTETHTWSAVAG